MKSSCIVIACLLFLCISSVSAQKQKTVEGTYTYYASFNITPAQAEQEAIHGAQVDAIGKEFGRTVSQNNVSTVSNEAENFYMEGFSMVKGEWIETIGTPEIERAFTETGFYVKCTIRGKAREVKNSKVEIETNVLCNNIDKRYANTEFHPGERLYLQFKTPVNGYITVFLHDKANDIVSCMLPYRRDDGSAVEVKGNQDYVFFSKAADVTGKRVDEYVMNCDSEQELNVMYILFSKNPFATTILTDDGKPTSLRMLSYDKFVEWMTKVRTSDTSLQITQKNIIIKPN